MLSPQQASLYTALAIFFFTGRKKKRVINSHKTDFIATMTLFNLIRDCK